MRTYYCQKRAQVAIEYLLIMAAVVMVVLMAFTALLPRTREQSGNFFNEAIVGIMGDTAVKPPDGPGKARTFESNYP